RDRPRHEQDAQGDEKGDRLLATGHGVILGNSKCKIQNANRDRVRNKGVNSARRSPPFSSNVGFEF
ncbi:MAG TPA: hypothetical protein VKC35_09085, partial [Vicinamibacterales bacterium]|nr:hypothetical protein [Vicinamibacterales bacterium]